MPRTQSGIPYTVRESSRAKRVIIKVHASSHVEVVVPKSFDRSRLREIVELRSGWISQKRKAFFRLKRIFAPKVINLKALGERWHVTYESCESKTTRIEEAADRTMILRGPTHDPASLASALNAWIHRKAKFALGNWLHALSRERSISFNRLTIKRQKTRWGSCSSKKNINLNRNLLFLPKRMVTYVLLHELCHIEQPNHSKAFWDLLENHLTGSLSMAVNVKEAGGRVPDWAKY